MGADRLINMVVRMFLRKVIGRGMDAGLDRMARSNKNKPSSPEGDRAQKEQGRDMAKRGRSAMRVVRRISRF